MSMCYCARMSVSACVPRPPAGRLVAAAVIQHGKQFTKLQLSDILYQLQLETKRNKSEVMAHWPPPRPWGNKFEIAVWQF